MDLSNPAAPQHSFRKSNSKINLSRPSPAAPAATPPRGPPGQASGPTETYAPATGKSQYKNICLGFLIACNIFFHWYFFKYFIYRYICLNQAHMITLSNQLIVNLS